MCTKDRDLQIKYESLNFTMGCRAQVAFMSMCTHMYVNNMHLAQCCTLHVLFPLIYIRKLSRQGILFF